MRINNMNDKNGEELTFLDDVVLDHGARGYVIGAHDIAERRFVEVKCAGVRLYATENAITKI